MKMRSLLFICLFSATALCARANDDTKGESKPTDISGGVINSDTRKPVNNVNVIVISADTKEKWVTSTDQNGNYSFSSLKGGAYKVVFQKDGYKKVIKEKIWIKEDENFQINTEMTPAGDFQIVPNLLLFDHTN